jgi:hypothetical protein
MKSRCEDQTPPNEFDGWYGKPDESGCAHMQSDDLRSSAPTRLNGFEIAGRDFNPGLSTVEGPIQFAVLLKKKSVALRGPDAAE